MQGIIFQRNEHHESNINQIQNENGVIKNNDTNAFKRQLTPTSQFDEEEINDDYGNPFVGVTKNRRKQQKVKEKEGTDVIEHTSTSTSNKYGGRVYVNSSKRTSKSDHMFYVNPSSNISHRSQHAKERKEKISNGSNEINANMNSNSRINLNGNVQETSESHTDKENLHHNGIIMSQHALNYAVEQHLPPIHIRLEKITAMCILSEFS